nr:hypothetical protein [Nocardia amamiensis]
MSCGVGHTSGETVSASSPGKVDDGDSDQHGSSHGLGEDCETLQNSGIGDDPVADRNGDEGTKAAAPIHPSHNAAARAHGVNRTTKDIALPPHEEHLGNP